MPSLAAKARLALQRLHLRSSKQSSEVADTMSVPESADYIIVGGGTAGLVIANRLSEDSKVSVLVLEAGTNHLDDPNVNVPAFWTQLIGTDVDWQLKTVTQPHLNNRTIKLPQGKLLGGSSAINNQTFVAPSKAGIDAWAKLGNPGWDWDSMLPFYKKFYTLTLPDKPTMDHLGIDWINESSRGTSGPLQVSFPGVAQDPVVKAWIDTFKAMHFNTTGDPFAGKSIGAYSNAASVDPKTKTRSYAASQFIKPVYDRTNLHIVTGALAQKITLHQTQGDNFDATHVHAIVDGKEHAFKANKEIILSAGVYHSPKLLELSGIGDEHLLHNHGISTLINNPNVGEHLQDHLMTGISFEVVDGVHTGDPLMRQEPEAIQTAMKLYQEHQAGPFCVGGTMSHAYMPIIEFAKEGDKGLIAQSELINKHDERAPGSSDKDYHNVVRDILNSPTESSGSLFIFMAQANLHDSGESTSFVGNKLQPENFASIGTSQCHPFSRGNVHISSSNVNDKPHVDPKYLSHPLDLEFFARHVQELELLRESEPLKQYFRPDGKRNHPDAHVKTLEQAKKYVADTALTTYHAVGSCAMLPKEKGGVVDNHLKVYGTNNLRVADASIVPLIPRGNPQSTVYAIGERAADIIKKDAK